MAWHKIATLHEVAPGERKFVAIGDQKMVLVHADSGLWCIDMTCPHTGGPLGEGDFTADTITCPLHKWKFRLDDGTHNRRNVDCKPAGVYQLKVEGEDLFVQIQTAASS